MSHVWAMWYCDGIYLYVIIMNCERLRKLRAHTKCRQENIQHWICAIGKVQYGGVAFGRVPFSGRICFPVAATIIGFETANNNIPYIALPCDVLISLRFDIFVIFLHYPRFIFHIYFIFRIRVHFSSYNFKRNCSQE